MEAGAFRFADMIFKPQHLRSSSLLLHPLSFYLTGISHAQRGGGPKTCSFYKLLSSISSVFDSRTIRPHTKRIVPLPSPYKLRFSHRTLNLSTSFISHHYFPQSATDKHLLFLVQNLALQQRPRTQSVVLPHNSRRSHVSVSAPFPGTDSLRGQFFNILILHQVTSNPDVGRVPSGLRRLSERRILTTLENRSSEILYYEYGVPKSHQDSSSASRCPAP